MSAESQAPKARAAQHRPELDGLRALAVLAVVVFHTLTGPQASHPFPNGAGVGARGVDLFFVLSGFCLSWPYSRDRMSTARHMLAFYGRRLTRIVPTCWIAIALFAALALTRFGVPSMSGPIAPREQIADLVRDAFFVPTLLPYHDPALWTLGFEMRWYLLFPMLLMVFFRSKTMFAAIAIGAFALNRAVLLPDAGILPCFMLGVVAAWIAKRTDRSAPFAALLALIAVGIAVAEQCALPVIDHSDPIWQLACFAFVLAAVTDARLRRLFSLRPLVWIGIASYSIYLVHLPIISALEWARVPPLPASVCGVAAGIAFWYVVERPLCSTAARGRMARALNLPALLASLRSKLVRTAA